MHTTLESLLRVGMRILSWWWLLAWNHTYSDVLGNRRPFWSFRACCYPTAQTSLFIRFLVAMLRLPPTTKHPVTFNLFGSTLSQPWLDLHNKIILIKHVDLTSKSCKLIALTRTSEGCSLMVEGLKTWILQIRWVEWPIYMKWRVYKQLSRLDLKTGWS